jgi:hypothetical protein
MGSLVLKRCTGRGPHCASRDRITVAGRRTHYEEERCFMLTWTDCAATTPEQQIICAQREILRRIDPARGAAASTVLQPSPDPRS